MMNNNQLEYNQQLHNTENIDGVKDKKYELFNKIFSVIRDGTADIYALSQKLNQESLTENEVIDLSRDINVKSENMYVEAMNFLAIVNDEHRMIELGTSQYERLLIRAVIHDIKNDFNRILGFSSVLVDGDLSTEEINKYPRIISYSSENANFLAANFLLFESADLNKIKVNISEIKLSELTNTFIEVLTQKAQNKKINFENQINDNITVMADSIMLQSVLTNLISNAIKFTKIDGHILISSKQKDDKIEISVSDNGQGLTEEKKKKFFDNLGVTTIGTSREKGTGIGVYVCKKMVDIMNGSISVESEGEGKGTTIIVTLPAGNQESNK